MIPTYEDAKVLLEKYNKSEALVRHGVCVGGAMRHFAKVFGENEETWAVVGLLHDLDYEMYPEQHCAKTLELLRENGIDETIARACASHGWGICTDIKPESRMEKTLYTIDELTGLIYAAALMRPEKDIAGMETKSVKKKFKTKSLAAGVNRELIEQGCEMLEMPLDTVIEETLNGMKEISTEIGL